jgi:hypothetical protein
VLATAEALYVAATDDRKRELKERYGYRGRRPRDEPAGRRPPAIADQPGHGASGRLRRQHKPRPRTSAAASPSSTGDPEAFARA